MSATIPDDKLDLFAEPALGHVSHLDAKGRIVTFPMWVDYDGTNLLTSSPVGSVKGKAWRENPQVGVSIASPKNGWHWLSISGHVVGIRPDEGLAFIDRMSRKYTGQDYQRRANPREIFVIQIDRVSPSWG